MTELEAKEIAMAQINSVNIKWNKLDQIVSERNCILLDSGTKQSKIQPHTFPVHPVYIDQPIEIIADETRDTLVSNQQVNGWISYIGEQLYLEPSVESVHVTIDEGNVDFWVVIPKWDIEVVRNIAQSQARIIDILGATEKPMSSIDYHVIYRNGHEEKDLVPTRAIQLSK